MKEGGGDGGVVIRNKLFTLAAASHAPDTNVLLSGDKDMDMTSPVWPVN